MCPGPVQHPTKIFKRQSGSRRQFCPRPFSKETQISRLQYQQDRRYGFIAFFRYLQRRWSRRRRSGYVNRGISNPLQHPLPRSASSPTTHKTCHTASTNNLHVKLALVTVKLDRIASNYAELASANAVLREETSSRFKTIILLLETNENLLAANADGLVEATDRTTKILEFFDHAPVGQRRREG